MLTQPAADGVTVRGIRKLVPFVLVAALAAAPASARSVRFEDAVLREINAVRAEHGAPPLRLNRELFAAAGSHSQEMARRGFFAHESADGVAFSKRLRHFYPTRGYSSWAVGENLVWSSPGLSAGEAIRMWLESPPHRENLLNHKWREIGLSAVHSSSAPGVFQGREITVLTVDFGVRR